MGSANSHQLTCLLEGEVQGNRIRWHRSAKERFFRSRRGRLGHARFFRPIVPRATLPELIAALPPCLIGMEACAGVHLWARQFAQFGYTVRLMARPSSSSPPASRASAAKTLRSTPPFSKPPVPATSHRSRE
jgi:hypothetical protein